MRWFAIKAPVGDLDATAYVFTAQKTMYGGRTIAVGDPVFIFASENDGGAGLFARGIVSLSEPCPRTSASRQTPRVSIAVDRTATATRPLGRAELRRFRDRPNDGARAEVYFKLYRQATNKIVGLSDMAAAFLNDLF